jgi:thioesterase domain-containing protein
MDVIVAEVPGTHITMMAPPQVASLAERLGEILAAASAPGLRGSSGGHQA